jgi:thiol-disulfide isomerase/thioredoxin
MIKTPLLILLSVALSASAMAQSGRRIAATPSAPSAPIQPPTRPEVETTSGSTIVGPLLALPESFRERAIKGLDNTTFHLSDFKGQVVVINLWASWCGPCRREVPEYEKVRKAYAGRNVEFVGLTAEDPRTSSDRVNKFIREVSFGFRLGWADRDLARLLMDGKGAVPQTLVLDGDGRIVQHWSGYSTGQSGARLKQAIEGTLNEH